MPPDHTPVEASAPVWGTDALSALYCPECGMPAWVEWRDPAGGTTGSTTGGTTGGAVHVKVRCFARHWFLLLEDRLTDD